MHLDPVATATYVVTLSAPVAVWIAIRLARARAFDAHRLVQAVVLAMGWLSVAALEVRIRLAGGSGAFVAQAPVALQGFAHRLLAVHIVGAVATYAGWTWLAVVSWRRFGADLPGRFGRAHKRIGLAIFGGLVFTAASASAVFVIVFVLSGT